MSIYRITINAFNWTKDDSELIDFDNCSFEEDSLEINYSCKIYRIGDEIQIENINENKNDNNSSNNLNLNEYDESMKMGEIKYKDKKYYFIPNRKDDMNEITGEELFSWLIFKGNKYPKTKNKYKLREGDILKLGRVWLIVRAIHIPKKRLERKNTNCLISHHSQINESLNVNNDFKENKEYYKYLIEEDDSSDITENEEENEENLNQSYDKNKTDNINKLSEENKEEENNGNLKKKKGKFTKSKLIKIKKHIEKVNSKKTEKQKLCRICYMPETNSILDPLIKPCKCAGSMKYIHLKCLLHWLKTKIQVDKSEYIENNYFSLYSSEKVECELCKQIFPHFIKHKHRIYNLLELEQKSEKDKKLKKKINNIINYTDGDNIKKNKEKKEYQNEDDDDANSYVVFDTIPFDKTIPAYIYLSKFNKDKKLKIGRGLDMNLIMNDLSISRNHCQLELCDNGDILLQDNNSKFGTLVLVQAKQLEILKGQTLTLQIGRTFFNIDYKKNNSLFDCCRAEEIDKKNTYENMNYKSIKIDKNSIILIESDTEGSDKDEDKNSENDYENIIKNINNKKVNILKISKTKKNKEEQETKNNIDKNKNKDENILQKDIKNDNKDNNVNNGNNDNNDNEILIKGEQHNNENKKKEKEEENKKDNEN